MGIKYYTFKERNEVIAVLGGTKYDVIKRIAKITGQTKSLIFDPNQYLMPNTFRAIAKCNPTDAWDEEIGRRVAKQKVMDRYYRSYDKKFNNFVADVNTAMFEIANRTSTKEK